MGKIRWNPTEVNFFHGLQPPREERQALASPTKARMDLGGWLLGAAVIVLAREEKSRLEWTFHQVGRIWERAPGYGGPRWVRRPGLQDRCEQPWVRMRFSTIPSNTRK